MELKNTQLQKIDKYIEHLGIHEQDVKLELGDHIASILENEMFDDDEQSKMAFINYEIRSLVQETKEHINSKSIHSLNKIFRQNLFTPHVFVVLFVACICYRFMQIGFHGHGDFLVSIYFCVTPLALLIFQGFKSISLRSSNYRTKCMIKNAWMPLGISAGLGFMIVLSSMIIYDKYFGGFSAQIIGSVLCSLSFGLYAKTLFDTFATIPNMIRDEIELDNLNFKLLTTLV